MKAVKFILGLDRMSLIILLCSAVAVLLAGCTGSRQHSPLPSMIPATANRSSVEEATQQPDDDRTSGHGVLNAEEATQQPDDDRISGYGDVRTDTSIWTRIRAGFALADKEHPRVQADRAWYARHQDYLRRTFERAKPYLFHIVERIEQRDMPMEIALLPAVESSFKPFAQSDRSASGLWQFTPGTARLYGLKMNWWYDGRRDIIAATDAALNLLENLARCFAGDWLLALAAYNSGEGTVMQAIRRNQKNGKGTSYWELDLPGETRDYVPKLLAISSIVEAPQRYGMTLGEIADQPTLAAVDIGSQLDLAIAAELAAITLDELYTLNPAFNRWATAPEGPHRLLVPVEKAAAFKQKVAELPAEKRVKWQHHAIQAGESLGQIAMTYHTTVKTIQRVNNLKDTTIRAGNHLIIPVASRSVDRAIPSAEHRLHASRHTPDGGHATIHTVRRGDTLWDIAQHYKVSVAKLASWNGMAPQDTLRVGRNLTLWRDNSRPATTASSKTELDATTRKINYQIRAGDSLARIAQQFKVSIANLKRWNPGARGKYIQPGQRLVLFVKITRMAGQH